MSGARSAAPAIDVSRIILGCGNFGGIGSAPEFFGAGRERGGGVRDPRRGLGAGITTYDTADAYGGWRSETWLGRWVARTGHPVTLSTKVFHSTAGDPGDTGLAPERFRRQIRSSLERLGVDRVDMYLVHEPDPATPLADTMRVLDELVREGLVGSIGASNADSHVSGGGAGDPRSASGSRRFEWVQNSYSMLDREAEDGVLPFCAEHGLGFTPFSPLAGGWLTGKYTRDPAASGGLADDDAAGPTSTCRPMPSTTAWKPGRGGGASRHPHVDACDRLGAVAPARHRHRVRPAQAGAPVAVGQRASTYISRRAERDAAFVSPPGVADAPGLRPK